VPAADEDEILSDRDTLLHRRNYAQVLSARKRHSASAAMLGARAASSSPPCRQCQQPVRTQRVRRPRCAPCDVVPAVDGRRVARRPGRGSIALLQMLNLFMNKLALGPKIATRCSANQRSAQRE